jgi:hypothetical protein
VPGGGWRLPRCSRIVGRRREGSPRCPSARVGSLLGLLGRAKGVLADHVIPKEKIDRFSCLNFSNRIFTLRAVLKAVLLQ